MKKKLQHICFVLLVTSTSAYGGSCWDAKPDFDSCKLKAEQGDPDAQMLLGLVFKTERIPQDYQEDIKWYKKAAEQGVPQNYVIAYMFYNLAALSGNEQAKIRKDLISRKMTPLQKKEAVNITTHKIKNNQ